MHPVSALRALGGAGRRELLLAQGATKASIATALRAGLIDRTYRGVYSLAGTPRYVVDARMYRAQVTCVSWAEHLKLPLLAPPGASHLLVPRDRARRGDDRRPNEGVVLHRSESASRGLFAEPIAALADMATCLEPMHLVAVADAAVAANLVTRDDLRNLPHTTAALREWLTLTVDERSQSFIESLTRTALTIAGFDVRTQVRFAGIGDVDMLIGRLVIECDGYEFHHKPEQFANDRRRDQLLTARGFTVLRFTFYDCVHRMPYVVATVASVAARVNRPA